MVFWKLPAHLKRGWRATAVVCSSSLLSFPISKKQWSTIWALNSNNCPYQDYDVQYAKAVLELAPFFGNRKKGPRELGAIGIKDSSGDMSYFYSLIESL